MSRASECSNNTFPAHIIRDQVIIGITGPYEAITCKWSPTVRPQVFLVLVHCHCSWSLCWGAMMMIMMMMSDDDRYPRFSFKLRLPLLSKARWCIKCSRVHYSSRPKEDRFPWKYNNNNVCCNYCNGVIVMKISGRMWVIWMKKNVGRFVLLREGQQTRFFVIEKFESSPTTRK